MLIAFGYGVFNSVGLGRSEQQVTWETMGLICLLTIGFSTVYCFRTEARDVSSSGQVSGFFQNRKVLAVGLASIVVLMAVSLASQTNTVQAAVTNIRFKQALSSPYLPDSNSINKIVNIARTAASSHVPINPDLVNVAGKKFLEASKTNPNAWQGTLALATYNSSLAKESPPLPMTSCLRASSLDGITATLLDSRLSNCTQELDHIAWKNVVFESVTIVYHGGPTALENVRFENCQFSLDNTPRGRLLAQSLLTANPVTINLLDN
jgi:hypothetical protein